MKEFPEIGYSELTIELYEYLKNRYLAYGKSIPSFHNYINENKKYISWDMRNANRYVDYINIYTCNKSTRIYYSLQDLELTTKIYELW